MAQRNDFDWENLLFCIAERRVIPIVGKELLITHRDGEKILLERHLSERLAEALKLPPEQLSERYDLNEVALRYFDKGGERNNVYLKLGAIVRESELPLPEPLLKLAEIKDFNLFVSLTFDSLLSQAINQVRFGGAPETECVAFTPSRAQIALPRDLHQLTRPYVFHLFGAASCVSEYAVTDEDYLEFIHGFQSENRHEELNRLFDTFRENHLLFLGCGFENWLERFLIRTIINERLLSHRQTAEFIADIEARAGTRLAFFLQHYSTKVFHAGDPAQFIDELHKRWCEQNPGAQPAPRSVPAGGKMETGAIFLSYASEDRVAAQHMKEALEKAGLDVWFDQGSLIPGDAWNLEIRRNIQRCAVFVPFISTNAQSRKEGYFRKEWHWAIERAQGMDESLRFIQPVVLDDTPDGAEHIPAYFWQRQCSRFSGGDPTQTFVEQLVRLVRDYRVREAGA